MVDLAKILKHTFWNIYDNLITVIILSILWLITLSFIIFVPITTYIIFIYTHKFVFQKSLTIKDILSVIKNKWIEAYLLFLIMATISFVLIFNAIFYLTHFGFTGKLFFGIIFWLFIYLVCSFLYLYPSTINKGSIKTGCKTALYIPFAYPGPTIIIFLFSLFFILIELFIPILGICILASFLHNSYYQILSLDNSDIKIPNETRRISDLIRFRQNR